jgi:capsular polysaccharide biosynthesis protein
MQDKNTSSNYHDSALRLGGVVWRRRKWLAISAFIVPFAAALSLITAMPDLYRAKTTILVRQELVADPATTPTTGELEARLQLISEQILSRGRLEELVKRFDLYPRMRQRVSSEQVIERMRRDIRLERKQVELRSGEGATVAFTLSYQGWDPQVTARVVNALAAFYVQENEKMRRRQATAPRGVDPLVELQQDLMELRARYSESYPDVVQLKTEIAALQRLRGGSSLPGGQLPGAEAGVQAERMYPQSAPHSARDPALIAEPRIGTEDSRRGETTDSRKEQFLILDSAIVPTVPVAPNRIRLLFMALVLAIGFSVLMVLLAEQFDTSFHRRDELWGFTNMPILASIPRIVTRADIWLHYLRFSFISVLAVAGLGLLIQACYFLGQNGEQLVWMLVQRGS